LDRQQQQQAIQKSLKCESQTPEAHQTDTLFGWFGCLFVCLFVSGFVSTEFHDMFETAATELKCNFTLPPHDTTVIGEW